MAAKDKRTNETAAGEQEERRDHEAEAFKALGHPVRIRIFDFLRTHSDPVAVDRKSGDVRRLQPIAPDKSEEDTGEPQGFTVGEVIAHLASSRKTESTISHHLKEMRQAGLITMKRNGKNMICAVNHETVRGLTTFLGGEEDEGDDE